MPGRNGHRYEVTELGRELTKKALALQETLVFITVPGSRIDRPRKVLKQKMNEAQEAQFVELVRLLKDFTYYIIWEVSGTIFDPYEKDELAHYFLTEKLINCLAYYHPPSEFSTYYGQAVRYKTLRFIDEKQKDGTLNAISLDKDPDGDLPVINIDTLFLGDTPLRGPEEEIIQEEEELTQEMIIEEVLERASQLDEKTRSLLVLRFYHDCTFLEIAQRLGVSELTARTWYHKAIKTLGQPVMSQSSYNTHTPHTEES